MIVNKKQNKMKQEKYTPQPIDTTDVKLPEELGLLVEQMSKNVHEVWAETRIKQGWKYGEQRNDELKTHPCLVSYEELPEEEKEYDRNTSISTLKLIMKLGFKIRQS
jgi:ryanodine receptor 2